MNVIRIGLDLAKNIFEVFAVNSLKKLVNANHFNEAIY
ncbi:MAG: hypothetical protein OFPI_10650 [Osedax symbiont Rs2]|nr:MAG: hypothetical protein OFPI_10650 [Osedax symbiont Rs2]